MGMSRTLLRRYVFTQGASHRVHFAMRVCTCSRAAHRKPWGKSVDAALLRERSSRMRHTGTCSRATHRVS